MGYIGINICKCISLTRLRNRLEAVYITSFFRIISPFNSIDTSPIRVISHCRTLDKDKMQICCRSDIIQIIGINDISAIVSIFYPFILLFFTCQIIPIINLISIFFQKCSSQISRCILYRII